MRYTVIYHDRHNERRWKQSTDLETAENYGKQMTDDDNDYDICVPMYEYKRLQNEIDKLKSTLSQIETMCKTSK